MVKGVRSMERDHGTRAHTRRRVTLGGFALVALLTIGATGAVLGSSGVARGTSEAVGYPTQVPALAPSAGPAPAIAITAGLGTVGAPLLADRAGNFVVGIVAQNFSLDAAAVGSKTNRAGSGHYHVYVDHYNPASASASAATYVTLGAAPALSVSTAQLAKVGVRSGTHTLYLVPANNDHSLIAPSVAASTVIRLGPSLSIVAGTTGQPQRLAAGGALTIRVQIGGLKLNPVAIGKAAKAGEGHYHVYLDTFDPAQPGKNYVTLSATTSVSVSGAALAKLNAGPGRHTLYLVLVNNDHTPLNPIAGDSVSVDIAG